MNKNKFLQIISFLIPVLVFSIFNVAYGADGTIAPSTDCSENLSCAKLDSDSSNINFGCTNCNVSVSSSTGITGYAWGGNIGWINLAPDGVPVVLSSSGVLSGYAWGQNAGWINFAPDGVPVTITTTTGEFNGWAWSQNYGWIKFLCPGSACVTTDWRPGHGGNATYACSDGQDNDGDGLIDQADPGCYINPNYDSNGILTGTYDQYKNNETNPDDVCLNIEGVQTELPPGYVPDPTHLSLAWCIPMFLTVKIENPALQTPPAPLVYFSADITPAEKIINDQSVPPLEVADFTTHKIQAKVTGGTAENIEFFVNGDSIGDLFSGSVTLVSGTTDTYEIAHSFNAQCPEAGAGVSFTITAEATNNLGTLYESAPVEILVGRPCPTLATQCSDGINNDDGDTLIDCADPGCWKNGACDPSLNDEKNDSCLTNPDTQVCQCTEGLPTYHPENPICSTPCDTDPTISAIDPKCKPIVPTCATDSSLCTCFDNPSLCNCADNPTLPGCQVAPTAPAGPGTPGYVAPGSVIGGIFSPAVVGQINLGLKIAATASVAIAGIISLATALFLNPLSAPELVLIPVRLWSLLLTALGVKKRRKPWGTVYDSITKQPLDPVYVSLRDLQGAEIASSITDVDGRYGFLVKPGIYKVVPRKTNYIFPSDKLSKHFRDEFYANLYFGDYINIKDSGEVIVKNIPMDAINFDWNEFEKNKKSLFKFYSRREILIAKISNWLFGIGFVIAGTALVVSPEKYNIIIFGLYVFMFVLRRTSFRLKAKGRIVGKDGSPLSFASIRAFAVDTNIEMAHQAADEMGRYHIIIPNGTYYVKIESKNNDGSYSVVHTSNYFKVVHGVLNRVFNI